MGSPFPGMDPYLERHWGDVHTSMITYARDRLQKKLPRDLLAQVEERVVIAAWSSRDRANIQHEERPSRQLLRSR